jgi:hypothetical protein
MVVGGKGYDRTSDSQSRDSSSDISAPRKFAFTDSVQVLRTAVTSGLISVILIFFRWAEDK